jgi:hypothetical protein
MQAKIVERKLNSGETEYGVQYSDGHITWFGSLPHAKYALDKNTAKKQNRKKQI